MGGGGDKQYGDSRTNRVASTWWRFLKLAINDVGVTEHSIGFDTAVNIATEALDRLHFTAASQQRVIILEVMGRDAGHIAISAGIAGADVI